MVTIVGKLNQSVTGIIRATPDHPFVDSTTDPDTWVSLPYESAIANGEFSIAVPQSQNLYAPNGVQAEGVTYKWELLKTGTAVTYQLLDGTPYEGTVNQWTDNNWYTGSVYEDGVSRRLDRIETPVETALVEPVHAIAPDDTNDVQFTDLFGIPSQQPGWDIAIRRIAKLLIDTPEYRDAISSKLSFKGAYDAATAYLLGDVVSYNGGSYSYRNASSQAGQTPPIGTSNEFWQLISTKGDPGGTGATIIGYGSNWDGSAEAAARNDVYDEIEILRNLIAGSNPDLSAYLTIASAQADYAPKIDPIFSGSNVERAAIAYPGTGIDRTTEIPTMDWVDSAIANRNLLGRPLLILSRNAQQNFTAGTRGSIVWDTQTLVSPDLSYDGVTGQITFNVSGRFYFSLQLDCYVASSPSVGRALLEAFVTRISPNAGDIAAIAKLNLASTANLSFLTGLEGNHLMLDGIISSGDVVEIQYVISSLASGISSSASAHRIASGGNGESRNRLVIWKVV